MSKSFIFLNGGNWIFIEKTDAETPIVWPHDAKSWLTGKDADAGKDGGQEVKGVTEDEMAGWHHRLNRHELEQTPRNSEGQGSLVCCSLWSCRVRHYLATQQRQEMVITANPATIWTIWRGTLWPTTWLQFKSFSTHHFFYRIITPTSSYLCTYGSFFLEFIFFLSLENSYTVLGFTF